MWRRPFPFRTKRGVRSRQSCASILPEVIRDDSHKRERGMMVDVVLANCEAR